MINKNLENKLKKKWPHVIMTDIKPVDPFDLVIKSRGPATVARELYMLDIQPLLCQIVCSSVYNSWPRWCRLNKPQNITGLHIIVVEGFSTFTWSECLIKYGDSKRFMKYFELFNAKFERSIRFINPISYGLTWKSELFEIPMGFLSTPFRLSKSLDMNIKESRSLTKSLKRKFRKMNAFQGGDISILRQAFKLDKETEQSVGQQKKIDIFPRTQLLLSLDQMKQECIPIENTNYSQWNNFKYLLPNGYKSVTDLSPIYAVDCEMVECMNEANGKITRSLASISIIDENRKTVYHKYVKPANLIVNYLTPYSGITPAVMESTSTTLEMVQNDLTKIIPPDAILAGHSIGNDLEALELFHPYLIDTSIIYNLKGLRGVKPKLKDLCNLFLNREIQNHKASGHDSVEDALATMDLILLKLSKSIDFGDATADEDEGDSENLPFDDDPILDTMTINPIHLRHKKLIEDCKNIGESVNLMSCVLPSLQNPISQNVVSSLNEMEGFTEPWFPIEFHNVINALKCDETGKQNEPLKNRERKVHPLHISIVDCTTLKKNDLPSKKWITMLLKKVTEEFDALPTHSLCGLIFTDGACETNSSDESFGRMYFAITSLNESQ